MPVILAAVLGAVAGPRGRLAGAPQGSPHRRRGPRPAGLVAIGVLIFCLVFGGISANSGDISTKADLALDKIQGWLEDLGVDNAQSAKEDVKNAAPELRTTLLSGVA